MRGPVAAATPHVMPTKPLYLPRTASGTTSLMMICEG